MVNKIHSFTNFILTCNIGINLVLKSFIVTVTIFSEALMVLFSPELNFFCSILDFVTTFKKGINGWRNKIEFEWTRVLPADFFEDNDPAKISNVVF